MGSGARQPLLKHSLCRWGLPHNPAVAIRAQAVSIRLQGPQAGTCRGQERWDIRALELEAMMRLGEILIINISENNPLIQSDQ